MQTDKSGKKSSLVSDGHSLRDMTGVQKMLRGEMENQVGECILWLLGD